MRFGKFIFLFFRVFFLSKKVKRSRRTKKLTFFSFLFQKKKKIKKKLNFLFFIFKKKKKKKKKTGMFALRERRVHVTQEDFEMAVPKVMRKDGDKSMSLRKLWK